VHHREREEQERERLSELQDRREAEELAKLETRSILSLAREWAWNFNHCFCGVDHEHVIGSIACCTVKILHSLSWCRLYMFTCNASVCITSNFLHTH